MHDFNVILKNVMGKISSFFIYLGSLFSEYSFLEKAAIFLITLLVIKYSIVLIKIFISVYKNKSTASFCENDIEQ